MVDVKVAGGELSTDEIDAYVKRAREKYPDKMITGIDITVDGDFVDMTYHWQTVPFDRIRRITGYLVGTLDRFNNGKRAEEADRVKHGLKQ
jgi:hypothetical protein